MNTVVVGMDGSVGSWTALAWATQEARQTGRGLLLVTVCDPASSGVDDLTEARRLLTNAQATTVDSDPDLPVRTVVLVGDPVDELVELTRDAALVVLGRHGLGFAARLQPSVARGVLAHGHSPVVLVSTLPSTAATDVLVGVSESIGGRAALAFAFAEAALRGARVVAVRSTQPDGWALAAALTTPAPFADMLLARERTVVSDVLRPFTDRYPDVPVHTVISGLDLERLLGEHRRDAAMAVLGSRRDDGTALAGRLGPVASTIARRVDFPVVVVGHPPQQVTEAATAIRPRATMQGDE